MKSVFLANLHYFFAQTDGTYKFPSSTEGDLLNLAKKEIESLLNTIAQQPQGAIPPEQTAPHAADVGMQLAQ